MQDKPNSTLGSSSTSRANQGTQAGGAAPADLANQAKEAISNVASQASDKVTSRLDQQRSKAADGLGSVAQALRQTSDQLRGQDQAAAVPQYVSSAADQVERFSGYVRSTDVRQMIYGVEQFARRQPALFLGGALVLGLVGARFLKSSDQGNSDGTGSSSRGGSLVPRDEHVPIPTYGTGSTGQGPGRGGYGSPATNTLSGRREDL